MTLFTKLNKWVEVRFGISEVVEKEMTGYLLPRTINSWYSLGSVLLFAFVLQIFSGNFLQYSTIPYPVLAFHNTMNECIRCRRVCYNISSSC